MAFAADKPRRFPQVSLELALHHAQRRREQLGLREIAGRAMDTYHRWMEVKIYATFAGLPALAITAGLDKTGRLPMGLQLIGKPLDDAGVLRMAAACEPVLSAVAGHRPDPASV